MKSFAVFALFPAFAFLLTKAAAEEHPVVNFTSEPPQFSVKSYCESDSYQRFDEGISMFPPNGPFRFVEQFDSGYNFLFFLFPEASRDAAFGPIDPRQIIRELVTEEEGRVFQIVQLVSGADLCIIEIATARETAQIYPLQGQHLDNPYLLDVKVTVDRLVTDSVADCADQTPPEILGQGPEAFWWEPDPCFAMSLRSSNFGEFPTTFEQSVRSLAGRLAVEDEGRVLVVTYFERWIVPALFEESSFGGKL